MAANWEYRSLLVEGPEGQSALTKAGQEGWEMVGVSDGVAFLKRPVETVQEPPPQLPPANLCGGCSYFGGVGSVNKKSGLVPGFCNLHQWSTNTAQTCEKFDAKKQ